MANNHLDIIIGENAAPEEVKIKVKARQVGISVLSASSFPREIETKEDYRIQVPTCPN